MIKLFFVVLLLVITKFYEVQCDKLECLEHLVNMTLSIKNDYSYFIKKFSTFYLYSGKQLADLGDYIGCLDQPHSAFSTMVLLYEGQSLGGLGVCLDASCDANALNQLISQALELFNVTYQLGDILQTSKGISAYFIPLSTTPSYKNAGFWITIVICFMLVMLSLADPILQYKKKSESVTTANSELKTTLIQSSDQNQLQVEPKKNEDSNNSNNNKSLGEKIIHSFSIINNWEKFKSVKQYNEELKVFNAIRIFSCLEVVYGHCFSSYADMTSYKQYFLKHLFKSDMFLFVYSNFYAVDVFFYLGGFFVAYVILDPKKVSNFNYRKPLSIFLAFLHRLIRLWPSLIVCLLIDWKIAPYIGSGPIYQAFQEQLAECDTKYNGWWERLLFFSNLTNNEESQACFGWAWYLDNDVQIFILCLLLLALYYHSATLCKIATIGSILGSTIGIIYVSFHFDLGIFASITTAKHNYNFNEKFYLKPWMRCPPYLLGLLFGIYYREYYNEKKKGTNECLFSKLKLKIHSTWYTKWILYIVGTGIINVFIWGPRQLIMKGSYLTNFDSWPSGVQNLWNSLCRLLYCFGIGLVTLPGILGSKDIIVRIFSCDIIAFFAKLTYTTYLIHLVILGMMVYSISQTFVFSETIIQGMYVLLVLLSVVSAMLINIFVELPFINLDSLIFNRNQKSSSQPKLQELNVPLLENSKQIPIQAEQLSQTNNDQENQMKEQLKESDNKIINNNETSEANINVNEQSQQNANQQIHLDPKSNAINPVQSEIIEGNMSSIVNNQK